MPLLLVGFENSFAPVVDFAERRATNKQTRMQEGAPVDGDREPPAGEGNQYMRFMVIVKATPETESSVMPTEQELTEMGAFNEELVNAGILQAGEGLLASSKGARIHYSGDERTVTDGPFIEAKELVAGFWIWKVDSLADAVAWSKRIPFREGSVEIRQVAEMEDFGDAFTPELQAQEQRLRDQSEAQ